VGALSSLGGGAKGSFWDSSVVEGGGAGLKGGKGESPWVKRINGSVTTYKVCDGLWGSTYTWRYKAVAAQRPGEGKNVPNH